jgi:hypothetical protein
MKMGEKPDNIFWWWVKEKNGMKSSVKKFSTIKSMLNLRVAIVVL